MSGELASGLFRATPAPKPCRTSRSAAERVSAARCLRLLLCAAAAACPLHCRAQQLFFRCRFVPLRPQSALVGLFAFLLVLPCYSEISSCPTIVSVRRVTASPRWPSYRVSDLLPGIPPVRVKLLPQTLSPSPSFILSLSPSFSPSLSSPSPSPSPSLSPSVPCPSLSCFPAACCCGCWKALTQETGAVAIPVATTVGQSWISQLIPSHPLPGRQFDLIIVAFCSCLRGCVVQPPICCRFGTPVHCSTPTNQTTHQSRTPFFSLLHPPLPHPSLPPSLPLSIPYS